MVWLPSAKVSCKVGQPPMLTGISCPGSSTPDRVGSSSLICCKSSWERGQAGSMETG